MRSGRDILEDMPKRGKKTESDLRESPQRSRLALIALLALPVLLGGGQAQCSIMSGEDRNEEDDDDDGDDNDNDGDDDDDGDGDGDGDGDFP